MKAILVIANFVFSLLLLTYNGEDLDILLFIGCYFALSCYLIERNKRIVIRRLDRFNHWLESLLK